MKTFCYLMLTTFWGGLSFGQTFTAREDHLIPDNSVVNYQREHTEFKSTIDFKSESYHKLFDSEEMRLAFKAILKKLMTTIEHERTNLSCYEMEHDDNPTVEVVLHAVGSKSSFGYKLTNIPENFSPVICLFDGEVIFTKPNGQVISDTEKRINSGRVYNVQFRQVFVDNGAQYQADPNTQVIKMSAH